MLSRVFGRSHTRQTRNDENLPTTRKAPKLHPLPLSRSILLPLPPNFSDLLPNTYTNFLCSESSKTTNNCLETHQISQNVRAKMIDWIVEVTSAFHMSMETLFLSVKVMDYFLCKSLVKYGGESVHLIGITCMLIASKYEEVEPFRVKTMVETVAKRKFTAQDILTMELVILDAIQFEVHLVTSGHVLGYLCNTLRLPQFLHKTAEILLVINQMSMVVQAAPPSLQAVAALTLVCSGLNKHEALPMLVTYAQGRDAQRLAAQMKANVVMYHRENEQSVMPKYLGFSFLEGQELPFVLNAKEEAVSW